MYKFLTYFIYNSFYRNKWIKDTPRPRVTDNVEVVDTEGSRLVSYLITAFVC